MANKKNDLRIAPRKKGFWETVKEMIGRTSYGDSLFKFNARYDIYGSLPSIDYSKTNYTLTRAIYHASEVEDRETGGKEGSKFLFGAVFGKPIVNSAAAFAIGRMPTIDITNENEESATKKEKATELYLNEFVKQNKNIIFKAVRNSYRDGDGYIRMRDKDKLELVMPDSITKVYDPLTGEIQGYDINHYVQEEKGAAKSTIKYIEKLRKLSPYREVFEVKDGKQAVMTEMTEKAIEGDPNEERPLPIIHFANELEASMLYGITEYQSCYYLMSNYHSVLENAIKGNIYNSTPVPVAKGVEDMDSFLSQNFDKNDDGEYEIKWDTDKFMIGGKEFSIDLVTADDSTDGASRLLNIIFWLICQTSETPEFLMGTAVQSSQASVETQLPVVIKKAERKQAQLETPLKELLELYLYNSNDNDIDIDVDFTIQFLPIVERDMKVNIEIVKLLKETGAITDETSIKLLDLGGQIKNPTAEVDKAHKEGSDKVGDLGVFKEMDEGRYRDEMEKIGGTISEMADRKSDKADKLVDDLVDLRSKLSKIAGE